MKQTTCTKSEFVFQFSVHSTFCIPKLMFLQRHFLFVDIWANIYKFYMNSRYSIENGLRSVRPYYHLSKVHVKPRWFGRTLVDVFTSEFGEKEEHVLSDIHNNHLYIYTNYGRQGGPQLVQGLENLAQHKLESCDFIHNNRHMHEPSVCAHPIDIVFQNEDVIVVNKPAGIPTHPTASYLYNSVTEIVKDQQNLSDLWTCHRLDKVTSGILILAKTKEAGRYYSNVIQTKKSHTLKEYVARVQGNFPEGRLMLTCPIFSVNSTGGYIKPLNADAIPTNSTTIFEKIKYSPSKDESIVKCVPLTGKMHQIRIHLRNLKHPITNDFVYNPVDQSLDSHHVNTMNNNIERELYSRLFKEYPQFSKLTQVDMNVINDQSTVDLYALTGWRTDEALIKQAAHLKECRQALLQSLKKSNNVKCEDCHRSLFTTDKNMAGSEIWLHAYRYAYPESERKFDFQTNYPDWCTQLFEID